MEENLLDVSSVEPLLLPSGNYSSSSSILPTFATVQPHISTQESFHANNDQPTAVSPVVRTRIRSAPVHRASESTGTSPYRSYTENRHNEGRLPNISGGTETATNNNDNDKNTVTNNDKNTVTNSDKNTSNSTTHDEALVKTIIASGRKDPELQVWIEDSKKYHRYFKTYALKERHETMDGFDRQQSLLPEPEPEPDHPLSEIELATRDYLRSLSPSRIRSAHSRLQQNTLSPSSSSVLPSFYSPLRLSSLSSSSSSTSFPPPINYHAAILAANYSTETPLARMLQQSAREDESIKISREHIPLPSDLYGQSEVKLRRPPSASNVNAHSPMARNMNIQAQHITGATPRIVGREKIPQLSTTSASPIHIVVGRRSSNKSAVSSPTSSRPASSSSTKPHLSSIVPSETTPIPDTVTVETSTKKESRSSTPPPPFFIAEPETEEIGVFGSKLTYSLTADPYLNNINVIRPKGEKVPLKATPGRLPPRHVNASSPLSSSKLSSKVKSPSVVSSPSTKFVSPSSTVNNPSSRSRSVTNSRTPVKSGTKTVNNNGTSTTSPLSSSKLAPTSSSSDTSNTLSPDPSSSQRSPSRKKASTPVSPALLMIELEEYRRKQNKNLLSLMELEAGVDGMRRKAHQQAGTRSERDRLHRLHAVQRQDARGRILRLAVSNEMLTIEKLRAMGIRNFAHLSEALG